MTSGCGWVHNGTRSIRLGFCEWPGRHSLLLAWFSSGCNATLNPPCLVAPAGVAEASAARRGRCACAHRAEPLSRLVREPARENTRTSAQGAVKGRCCSRSSCSASRARASHSCSSSSNRALVISSIDAAALTPHTREVPVEPLTEGPGRNWADLSGPAGELSSG